MVRVVNGAAFRVLPGHSRFFSQDYDAPVAAFLRDRVKPGETCINVGANVGVYTLQFAKWNAPDGPVIAFEPNPATAAILKRHVALNGLGGRVRVMERAVAETPGTATFYVQGTDGMSRLGVPNPLLEKPSPIQVEVTTLDRFCEQERIHPHWILIDVEGFEPAVLAGFRETLGASKLPQVIVEMHPDAWNVAGSSREHFTQLLANLQLRPVPLTGQRDAMTDYGLVYLERLDANKHT